MEKAIELDARGSGVVARRDHLHRGDVQGHREVDLRQGRLRSRTRRACSTPASKATPGVPSTSMRATRSMKRRSKALDPRRRGPEHLGGNDAPRSEDAST